MPIQNLRFRTAPEIQLQRSERWKKIRKIGLKLILIKRKLWSSLRVERTLISYKVYFMDKLAITSKYIKANFSTKNG